MRTFTIDTNEVTVGEYALCVKSGKCKEPVAFIEDRFSFTSGQWCNWKLPGRERHPMNCVDWSEATAYCQAQGKRLPTREEWSWAASNGGRTLYPWGDEAPKADQIRWKSREGTAPVGTHPAGATFNGINDLAGNVFEWTSSDDELPFHPEKAIGKVALGGGWSNDGLKAFQSVSSRNAISADHRANHFGFRCAK